MTIRDREVLEELRDDPELLALADAVVETQRIRRPFRPWRAVTVVALAAALFLLVLASPWDRGGGNGSVLEQALAAIETDGPVFHLTMRMEAAPGGRKFPSVITESFYDKQRGLVRVISRSEGKVVGDYTSTASEDEFSLFPGLLEGAAFYRQALADGDARIIGKGVWEGKPVYWLELERGGGIRLRIGIARDSYRPVVFRALNPDGTATGPQVAVLGLDYVSDARAAFDTEASILATGRVVGPDCRPAKARVAAFLGDQPTAGEIAAVRTEPDGGFVLKANPERSPTREALSGGKGPLNIDVYAIANEGGIPKLIGSFAFSRSVKEGRWVAGPPVTIRAVNAPKAGC